MKELYSNGFASSIAVFTFPAFCGQETKTNRKLAAYAGIDPTMRQSGEYNGIRNRMSKRGSPYGAITQENERKCAYL